jgi:hypothetical protein
MILKTSWDAFLTNWNAKASRAATGAWHTSNIWVLTEAQQQLLSSTFATLLIVILLALAGMLVFTKDLTLSIYVVASTLGVIFCLTFFIVNVMQWPIGPVEVIALIVFVGYAVTYSLHIAHKYGGAEALRDAGMVTEIDDIRLARTQYSLVAIGGAALGSAATTIGCAMFLLFCTLTIFKKLGIVVLAVTVLSIFMALCPLVCLLLYAGPPFQLTTRLVASVRTRSGSFLGSVIVGQEEPELGHIGRPSQREHRHEDGRSDSHASMANPTRVAPAIVKFEERYDGDGIGKEQPLNPIHQREQEQGGRVFVASGEPPRAGTGTPQLFGYTNI